MVAQTHKQLQQNDDWEVKSSYDDSLAKPTNLLYHAANMPQEQKEKLSETDVRVGVAAYLNGIIGPVKAVSSVALAKLYDAATINAFLSDDERQIYNYLYSTKGVRAAEEWKRSFLSVLEDRRAMGYLGTIKDFAQTNAVTATIASAASVPASLLSAAEYVGDALKYMVTGEMDTNSLSQISNTIRGAVTEKYDWEIEALNDWDAFDFVYNTGMSAADSLATLPIGGWGSAAVLGLSAAASATNEALERGLDDKHAFWAGVAAGAFEMIFEKVSIGQFESMKDGITGGLKDAAWNTAKAMLVNASEETLTEIANIVYDTLANGELSAYETSIRAKIAQGMSKEDAARQASRELGVRIAEAAASGVLMGLGFGGVSSSISYADTAKVGDTLKASNAGNAVIDLGKTMEHGSQAYTLAMELDGKENATDAELGELYILITEQAAADGLTAEDLVTQVSESHESDYAAIVANAEAPTSDVGDGSPVPTQAPAIETKFTAPTVAELTEAFETGAKRAGYVPSKVSVSTDTASKAPTAPANNKTDSPTTESPATETTSTASTEPTVEELIEAFKAGVEGRKYVPKVISSKNNVHTEVDKSDIIESYVTGGRNPYGIKAEAHAQRYYAFIRKIKSDVHKIAKTSKLPPETISKIKEYLFIEIHDLGEFGISRFAPDYMIAESWRRLMLGKPLPHDLTLLKHEALERELVLQGASQQEAHIKASKKYNYQREAEEYYDTIEKYSD